MTQHNLIAKAETTINTPIEKVWDALTNPATIKQYMFNTDVNSDWTEGSKITWKGEWQGKAYEDKGEILKIVPNKKLQYTHFSPLTGLEDKPENYHTVTIDLEKIDQQTKIALTQDGNATEEERQHSQKNWGMMLESLKKLLEQHAETKE
jgi:uncharacterized protein YndB with AHSA1/START domain